MRDLSSIAFRSPSRGEIEHARGAPDARRAAGIAFTTAFAAPDVARDAARDDEAQRRIAVELHLVAWILRADLRA